MRSLLGLFCASLLSVSALAETADEVVNSTGIASSYRGAVNEALVSALERHDGITISATEVNSVAEDGSATSAVVNGVTDDRSKLEINDAINKSMQKWSKGRIKSYEVLSDCLENGKYRVEVAVSFAGKYECGLPEGNRRRMAVAVFRVETGDSFNWYGQSDSSAQWVEMLASRLSDRLTQTRKFSMLDRKFGREVADELSRLGDKNAAAADSVRLGQQLGTDYLLVGSVRFLPVSAPSKNPLTGQTMAVASQPFCEVSYRVLLAPTGQLKWSDTVGLDAVDFPEASIGTFASSTAAASAGLIADAVMSNLLPFEIVGRNDAGEIVIGEGGKSLSVGERLAVCVLGDEIRDTRTGEVLDQIETPVGDVEIVRVSPKVSYAKVIGGDVEKMTVGARLRRPTVNKAPAVFVAPPVTVHETSEGGVVTPF